MDGGEKLGGSAGAQTPYTNTVLYETKTERWSISRHPFDKAGQKGPKVNFCESPANQNPNDKITHVPILLQ